MTAPIKRLHTAIWTTDEKPMCPYGDDQSPHYFRPEHRPSVDGTLTCYHRDPISMQVCDTLCWVALFTHGGSAMVRGTGERLWIVVHVSRADLRHFSRTPMLVIEKLAYLGITPERVLRAFDLGGNGAA